MQERRASNRINFYAEISVVRDLVNNKTIKDRFTVKNISTGGIAARSDEKFEVGTLLRFYMTINGLTHECTCMIVRYTVADYYFEYGMQFIGTSASLFRAIQTLEKEAV